MDGECSRLPILRWPIAATMVTGVSCNYRKSFILPSCDVGDLEHPHVVERDLILVLHRPHSNGTHKWFSSNFPFIWWKSIAICCLNAESTLTSDLNCLVSVDYLAVFINSVPWQGVIACKLHLYLSTNAHLNTCFIYNFCYILYTVYHLVFLWDWEFF